MLKRLRGEFGSVMFYDFLVDVGRREVATGHEDGIAHEEGRDRYECARTGLTCNEGSL